MCVLCVKLKSQYDPIKSLEFPSKYVFHDKFIMCVKLTDILAKKKNT